MAEIPFQVMQIDHTVQSVCNVGLTKPLTCDETPKKKSMQALDPTRISNLSLAMPFFCMYVQTPHQSHSWLARTSASP